MAITYVPIFTTTLTSAASIDITSIPQTYTDLVLSAVLRENNNNSQTIAFSMNNINTGSYSYTNWSMVDGILNRNNSNNQGEAICNATGTGTWGAILMDIQDYTNTNINRVFVWNGWRSGTARTNIAQEQGVWMNTTTQALNRLTFLYYQWAVGSTVTLWGIKEA